MKCDLCGSDIHWWQDRHTTGNGNFHSACETHDEPLDSPEHAKPRSYKLNWFSSRASIGPRRSLDE